MRVNRERGLLQPLSCLGAEGIRAGQPLAVAEQCQEAVALGVRPRIGGSLRDRRELRHRAEAPGRSTHRCGLRVGVDDSRNGFVVGLARLTEDVRGDHLALVLADVRQRPEPVDVADRPEILGRAQVRVDRNAVRVRLDTNRFQPEPADARSPPGGDEQLVASDLASVVEFEDIVLAVAPRCRRVCRQHELDAFTAENLAERLAERRRLPREHVIGHVDDRCLAAEPPHRLRQLNADRPAAQDEQSARDGLHRCRLAAGPDAVQFAEAGNGGDDRIGAVREDDVLGGMTHTVDLDHTWAGEPSGAPQQIDPVVCQPAFLTGVGVVRDHEVAPGERRLDIDLGLRGGVARCVDRLARTQQRLRRDARPVRTLSSTSSRSTTATRRPPSARAPAQCSPGEPPPITITS